MYWLSREGSAMRVETESKRNSEQQTGQPYYYHCDEYWEADGRCTYYGGNCCTHNECSLKKRYQKYKRLGV
jgi:hypothetical protein